jgi:hypothetical protein
MHSDKIKQDTMYAHNNYGSLLRKSVMKAVPNESTASNRFVFIKTMKLEPMKIVLYPSPNKEAYSKSARSFDDVVIACDLRYGQP